MNVSRSRRPAQLLHQRILGHPRHQSELAGFFAAQHTRAVKVSSLATSIGTKRGSVCVSDMSGIRPHFDLSHRKAGIRMGDSNIGSQRDLQTTAQAVAVDCCDYRYWEPHPVIGHSLDAVGDRAIQLAVGSLHPRCADIALATSKPEQKLLPSPWRTTALTPGSAFT